MKLTVLALTAFALTVGSQALAQEETTTPAPVPETGVREFAPETSEPPAADTSVSVTTEKTVSTVPSKSSSPAATKSKTPAAPVKATSPAKTSSSDAPVRPTKTAAVMPTKKSTAEATLRDIENKWEASIISHDPSVAKAYLGADYRGVSSKGKVLKKGALLAEIKNDTDTYTSARNDRMYVRVFNGRFAVVLGRSVEAGKTKDGTAFKRRFRWTDSWVERNGKWQCVASQAMLLPK
jgi:hypothetical protein